MTDTGIILYTETITNRHRYIVPYITGLLGLRAILTTRKDEAENFEGPKIFYSATAPAGSLHIVPAGLLSENDIRSRKIETGVWDGLPVIFAGEPQRAVPFDIFSASFWLMSRYEEYLPFTHDLYGRFPARESLAFRAGFLDLPVVNLWASRMGQELVRLFPGLRLRKNRFHWKTTIDVDHTWAYLNKNILRSWGGLGKDILLGRDFKRRWNVLRQLMPDPYDTFSLIRDLHHDMPGHFHLFILSGKPGRHDPNGSPSHPAFRSLVSGLAGEFDVGLHPSWRSNRNLSILKKEYNTLSKLLPGPLTASRQHFLRLKFPDTYRNLINIGIRNDYSMGYPGQAGFRAGVCTPFDFYDLKTAEKTTLTLWPFCIMDRTLKDYLHKGPEESLEIIQYFVQITEQAGGWFIPVWHNDSLSGYGEWRGWENVYLRMLDILKSKPV